MNHEIQPGDDARDDGSQIALPCGPITIGTFVCPSGMFGGASAVMAALSATSFFVQHDVIVHSPPIASHIVRVDPVERRHSGILVHMPLAFERRSHPTFSMGGLALPFEPLAIIRGGSYPDFKYFVRLASTAPMPLDELDLELGTFQSSFALPRSIFGSVFPPS